MKSESHVSMDSEQHVSIVGAFLALSVGCVVVLALFSSSWQWFDSDLGRKLAVIIPSIFYLSFSFFSFLLAVSRPKFTDLWLFAAYCGSMFFALWCRSPFAELLPEFGAAHSMTKFVVNSGASGLIVVCATGLTLSFFRVRGLWLLLVLSVVAVADIAIVLLNSLDYGVLSAELLYQKSSLTFVALSFVAQVCVFVFGFVVLLAQRRVFIEQGLFAFLPAMRRRILSAVLFMMMMGIWISGSFVEAKGLLSERWSLALVLLSVAPTSIIFLQFYWMIMVGQQFREKLQPKLDYIDYLVLEMGEQAADKHYTGVLASFDLKGFKRITSLKSRGAKYRDAVNAIVSGIREEIAQLVASHRTVFRFKSNGDEWVWVFYAKDTSYAKDMLFDIVKLWQLNGSKILARQKARFLETIGEDLGLDASLILDFIDLHVMFCVLQRITISVGDGMSFPEFYADGFTNLSETFKTATHRSVAMFREEAEEICAKLPIGSHFERSNSAYCDAGFLKWDSPDGEATL